MRKLGVFICHCGVNIAGTVDVKSVAAKMGEVEDVAHSTDYIYMCSEPGQQIIREAIREKGLEGVVVACCSPSMHENTFRKAVKSQGMNPRAEISLMFRPELTIYLFFMRRTSTLEEIQRGTRRPLC